MLIVEDDDAFAAAVTLVLAACPQVELVGHARNGREGVALARKLRPDVIVMDIEMPIMDGVEATRRILAARPTTRVIAVSGSDYTERALEARFAGACDYVRKSHVEEYLVAAVTAAATAPRG